MKTILLIAVLLGLFPQTLDAKCAPEASDNIVREKTDTIGTTIITVNSSNDRIHIYPNPSRGAFFFNGVKGHSIEIQNALGLVICTAEADRDRYPIDLGAKGKGVYSYRIFDQGALVQQGKLVVE